jgi:RNA polymerase sigma-70 factor, ECF subfamily
MKLANLTNLVERAKTGDREAFGALIENTQEDVYRFCYYLCGNKARAQDLMQDAYVRVLENIKKLDDNEKFTSWVFRTAKNLYLDYLKSPRSKEQAYEDTGASEARTEAIVQIRQAFSKMTPEDRFLVLMADLQKASYSEIAQMLEISEEAVTSRIHKARENFKKILKS